MMTNEGQVKRLYGQKVILREKQLEDASNDYAWATDRELTRLDAAETYQIPFSVYLVAYHEGISDLDKKQFAIETLSGEHIGNCVCYNFDKVSKEAEMGILIGDREYWGKGYGTDAVKTLMQHIFEDMGMKRIFLHTLEWNIRAQECFERCGFTPCGRIVRKGQEFIEMEAVASLKEG
ncbi:MAG: GNAT family N-acetyltransferase [Chloroflexi bacterium]|nr:GNAT family N-acetyltransferase [Chloroflexota bacterium]